MSPRACSDEANPKGTPFMIGKILGALIGAAVLRSIDLLAIAMESFRERALDGLEPDRERIAALLDRSLMLVTALAPEIGYDNAARIAKHAHHTGLTLKEAGLELGLVDAETFDRAVRPEKMLGR